MNKKNEAVFDKLTQFLLPTFTILGFLLTSLKRPDLGLVSNLIAQVFWLYSSWIAWKKAKQFGIFITTLVITVILIFGVANYWILGNL